MASSSITRSSHTIVAGYLAVRSDRYRAGSPTITSYSDDAHELLTALSSTPSLIFGSSIGALIGLDLVARYPRQVSLLVAHEPPAWDVLPGAERDRAKQALADVEATFHREGPDAALRKCGALSAIDYADREADAPMPRPTPQLQANVNFLLTNDTRTVNDYHLDVAALRAVRTRIATARGRSSSGSAPRRCAERLAGTLGTAMVDLPGGHTGWLLRPKEFAARLTEVLRANERR